MMQMETQNDQLKQNQSVSVLMAGVAGLIAGAAGVTALALSDKEIRRKVGKKAKELRTTLQDWSADKLQMADHQKIEKTETVERVVDNTKEDEPFKQEVKVRN
jgi:hypothetical protein